MNYKEQTLETLKKLLEEQGASKHDISVILAFNETALENLTTYIAQLDNPMLAVDTLKMLSRIYNQIEGALYLFELKGEHKND